MASAILAAIAAASAAPSPPGAVRLTAPHARSVRLSSAQMLALAEQLLARGSREQAAEMLDLLARDPNSDIRNEARFRRSKLLAEQGQTSAAALLLRAIIDEKPGATPVRLELAQLLDRMGDKDGAWRQVRAAQAAGLPPAVARLVDRYSEALRAARAAGASLEIALAPDSNINRATRSDTLGTILGDFQIDDESKAKSGTGLALHSQLYRRFALREGRLGLLVRASGQADLYRSRRFNDVALDVAVGPELQLGGNRLNVELGATQRWFGKHPFLRSARIGASLAHRLGRRAQLRLDGSAALLDNRLNDLQDGRSYSGQLALERALTPTTGLAASLGVDRQSLRDPGYSSTGWRGGLTGWRDLGRVTLTAGVQLGRLHADERLLLFPDKRSDRFSRFSLGATFRQVQWRGFAPVVRLSVERNRSTIAFYDYRRTRSEIGIARAF